MRSMPAASTLVEINEAFAAVAITSTRMLEVDPRPRQRQRWGDRRRPSHRRQRRADPHDPALRAAPPWRRVRRRRDLQRHRAGRGDARPCRLRPRRRRRCSPSASSASSRRRPARSPRRWRAGEVRARSDVVARRRRARARRSADARRRTVAPVAATATSRAHRGGGARGREQRRDPRRAPHRGQRAPPRFRQR